MVRPEAPARSVSSRLWIALAVVGVVTAVVVYRLAGGHRPLPGDSPGKSPDKPTAVADPIEVFFVIADQAPYHDAASGASLGTLERGTWLRLRPDKKSFTTYDPWEKPITLPRNAVLPTAIAWKFFGRNLQTAPEAGDFADRAAVDLSRGANLQALADLDQALTLDPNLFRALQRRAECRRKLAVEVMGTPGAHKLVEEGLRDADRCVELRPDDVLAYDTRSSLRQIIYDVDGALSDLKRALEIRPNHSPLYSNRAKFLTDLGRDEEALTDLNRAIEASPEYADAYTNRGILRYRRGEFDAAIDDASTAIRFNPHSTNPLFNRGVTYARTGQFEKAVADFDEIIRLTPAVADGYFGRANVHFSHGEQADKEATADGKPAAPVADRKSTLWFHKAIEDCDAALKQNPHLYGSFNTKANALIKLDRVGEAIEMYDAALQAMAGESRVSKLVVIDDAAARHDAWDQVEAVMKFAEPPAHYDRRIHLLALRHPRRKDIAAMLANRAHAYHLLAKSGDQDAAPKVAFDLTRAIYFDEQNAEYYRNRGLYHLELKQFAEAKTDLTQALERRPNYPDALRDRIRASFGLGNLADAREDATRLEKLGEKLDPDVAEFLKQAPGK